MSRALGRYELLRPLARGGMGEVYLARRRAAGVEKWLVIKRMRPERAGDTRFLDLFMREAKLSMSLTHQNIVPVFDFGRIDDQVFLAMERVEGKDLGSSLQKAGKGLPPLLAAFIAVECLQALDYAHQRKGPDGAKLGIVHRDVTPRNVLLSWSGEVKLTDFGIAALAGDSPSRAAGTPAYMAPEQARGEGTDVRADIYAVGLVLREALTGERARGGTDRETVLQIAKQGVLSPWPDRPEAAEAKDSSLRAIIEKATASDREDRYPDARSMLEDLDTFLVGERAAKKSESPSRQLGAWLTDVWKDTKDDEGALDAQIEAGVLVSFIDDGLVDVAGSKTQLSALATAADDAVGPSQKIEVSAELSEASGPNDVRTVHEPTPSALESAKTEHAAKEPAQKPFPIALVGALGIAALALAFVGWRITRKDDTNIAAPIERRDAGVPIAEEKPDEIVETTPDAAPQIAEATPDGGSAIIEARADAAIAASTRDAGIVERPRPPVTRDAGTPAPADAALVTAPATAKRKVTINSKPWSNWTVDGGEPHSGLETIELAPGLHTIHFTGQPYNKVDKKVTITVPDRDGFTHFENLEPPPPRPDPQPTPAP